MNEINKADGELLRQKAEELLKKKSETEILELVQELAFQNEEKAKRADELVIANKELAFHNEEKEKRASELSAAVAYSLKLAHELQVHQVELEMQNDELRRAKEQIAKAANDKYAELYDFSPSGYFTLSKEGKIIEMNLCGSQMLGIDRSLLKNKKFGFFVSDESSPVFKLFLGKVFASKTKEVCEVSLSDNENAPIFVHLTAVVNQNSEHCLVTMVDITRREMAERALLESEKRLRDITLSMADWIWEVDKNGVYTYCSEKSFDFLGHSHEEIIGKTPFSFMQPEEAERVAGIFSEIMASRAPIKDLENSNIGKDGEIIYLLTNGLPIFDKDGNLTGYRGVDKDITERKLAEISLRQSEEKFRIIAENTSDTIVVLDMDFNMIYISPSVERILGYTAEEAILQKPHQILTPDSFQKFREMAERIIPAEMAGTARNIVYPAVELEEYHKNGSTVWVELSFAFIRDHDNKSTHIVTVARDITQRRMTEDSLRKSEELLKTVVSNSSDLTMLTDADGFLIFVSPQCETVLGYPVDKFIGLQIPDIIHPDDIEMVSLAWGGVYHEGKELRELEYRIIDEQGATRWVSHSAKKYCINEIAIGVASTIRLITDRKMTEQAIKEIDGKYKTMLNASPDAMLLIDLKGTISEVSEMGLHLFGVDTRDDLVGKDIFFFVPADKHNLLREMLVRTTNEGLAQNIAITVSRQNQSVFAGEISATLMQNPDGAPISFMIIIRDISLRKKMEAKQIHADRLTTLGEMAAGIAHEIGQPLNIISMVMDKILFEIAKPEMVDVGFLKIKSDKIFENITRIRDIIDHVKAFSSSRDEHILTAFNVNSSIVNAASMIMEQFKHHGINLNLQLEQQIPPIVGNTYKFEQVILNLLSNAKDAVTEKKSKLDEDFDMHVGIISWQETQCIFVEITDNGIGISKDDIHHIMLPFYTTKEEGKGTGLGLSICHQILKEMGGTIEISSESSYGTNIKLVLPLQKTM